jgi:Protein kinase domain
MLNISRLLRGLASLCPPELSCGTRVLTRSHGILVSIEFDQVVKVFPPPLFRGAKAHAEAVYKVLRDNKVPNVDSLISANSRKFELKFKPRGNDIRPSTLDELFLCLLDIFAALVELHKLSWMHRDIRWSNVMKRYGCSNSWFLIDFMDAAESPQCHDCEEQLSQEEHAPEIFGNSNHTVAVDIWSVGYLIKSSNCKWCDLGKEQSDFLNLLMDSDPSKRPNAKNAQKKVRHFKMQYENQSLETREKPPKKRRKK